MECTYTKHIIALAAPVDDVFQNLLEHRVDLRESEDLIVPLAIRDDIQAEPVKNVREGGSNRDEGVLVITLDIGGNTLWRVPKGVLNVCTLLESDHRRGQPITYRQQWHP